MALRHLQVPAGTNSAPVLYTDEGVVFLELGPIDPMRQFAANARSRLGS